MVEGAIKLHERAKELLAITGVGRHEIESAELAPVLKFQFVDTGFGLVGSTGTGKTVAMARVLAEFVQKVVDRKGPEARFDFGAVPFWVNWPEQAEIIKRASVGKDHNFLSNWVEKAKDRDFLFLDDLGQERVRGEDDLALGTLREILDYRYRNQMPVFWTSNLDRAALTTMYGARIVSRISEAWPGQIVTGIDLRLRSAK